VPDEALPIAAENIHSNYEDIDSLIEFTTSNKGRLTLYFPAAGGCIFFADEDGTHIRGTGELRRLLPRDIQVVPILGPLEHEEQIVSEETVRKNLMTTRASRNFRNYWYYAREGFSDFAGKFSFAENSAETHLISRSRQPSFAAFSAKLRSRASLCDGMQHTDVFGTQLRESITATSQWRSAGVFRVR
jgi:hypothetical protein